jgi:hypothetical protein
VTVIPFLYLLNGSIPFQLTGLDKQFLKRAVRSYFTAGGLIFLRTLAKIATYSVASKSAAQLGTVAMAAYTLTFSLGFTASQLCEALAIASQALLARGMPIDTEDKRVVANHVIKRSLQSGVMISLALTAFTLLNRGNILNHMARGEEVRQATLAVMPIVLLAQAFKGVSSRCCCLPFFHPLPSFSLIILSVCLSVYVCSTGGILLGGLDWAWSTCGMVIAAVLSVATIQLLPRSLSSTWTGLAVFTGTQVVCALLRIHSRTGPWRKLDPPTTEVDKPTSRSVPPVVI